MRGLLFLPIPASACYWLPLVGPCWPAGSMVVSPCGFAACILIISRVSPVALAWVGQFPSGSVSTGDAKTEDTENEKHVARKGRSHLLKMSRGLPKCPCWPFTPIGGLSWGCPDGNSPISETLFGSDAPDGPHDDQVLRGKEPALSFVRVV